MPSSKMIILKNIYPEIIELIKLISLRLKVAVLGIPTLTYFGILCSFLLLFSIVIIPLGFQFHFIKFQLLNQPFFKQCQLILSLLLMPAIAEEIIFRVLLLPNTKLETPSFISMILWGSITITAYVLYHPLNAITFYKKGFPVFLKPFFLLAVTFLGIICTIIYFYSGSLWTSVIIHWLVVVVWITVLNGYNSLSNNNS